MAAETVKFKMEDNEFELPEIDDLNMGEWELIYDRTGLILADFAPEIDEATGKFDDKAEAERQRRVSQPAFTRTMLQIALLRASPEMTVAESEEIALHAKLVEVLEAIGEEVVEDADASPPEPTPELEPSSPRSSDDSNGNASTVSTDASVGQVVRPMPTGTPE